MALAAQIADEPVVAGTQLGDMTVMADDLPPKMWKALAVIASRASAAYDERSGLARGAMGDKCLFASLAVRDFLVDIGFKDATIRPCFLYIDATGLDGKQIWSVGIGVPNQPTIHGKFNGHAVVTVPSLSLLIDPTVRQAVRPHWKDALGGMAAIKYHDPNTNQLVHGRPAIAGAEVAFADRVVTVIWADRPELNWKQEPDFRDKNARRRYVTRSLREAFGEWS